VQQDAYDLGGTMYDPQTDIAGQIKTAILNVFTASKAATQDTLQAHWQEVRSELVKEMASHREEFSREWLAVRRENESGMQNLKMAMASLAGNVQNFGRSIQGGETLREIQTMRTEMHKLIPDLSQDVKVATELSYKMDDFLRKAAVEVNQTDDLLNTFTRAAREQKDDLARLRAELDRNFSKVTDAVESSIRDPADILPHLNRALKDSGNEISDQFDRLHRKHDDLSRKHEDSFGYLQGLNLPDSFDRIHKKHDDLHKKWDMKASVKTDNDLEKVLKALDGFKGDSGINDAIAGVHKALKDHKDEMGGHMDRLHKKHDDLHRKHEDGFAKVHKTKVDVDLSNVLKALETQKDDLLHHIGAHGKNAKGEIAAINDAIGLVHKSLKDHGDEVGSHFDRMGRKHDAIGDSIGKTTRGPDTLDVNAMMDVLGKHKDELINSMVKRGDSAGEISQVMKAIRDHKDEVGVLHDRFHKKFDDYKEEMKGHFEKHFRKEDSMDKLGVVQKEVHDFRDEFRKELEKVRNIYLKDIHDDTKLCVKYLDGHRQDVASQFSLLHKKHDDVKEHFSTNGRRSDDMYRNMSDQLGQLMKTHGDHRNDLQSWFDKHRTEMSGHMDRVHNKIDNSKVDVDMQGALRSLESQKGKGDDGAINDAISQIHKAMRDHKDEMTNHFDKVHSKMDLSQIEKSIAANAADLARTMKDFPQRLDFMQRKIDTIASIVDPLGGMMNDHSRSLMDNFKSIRDKHDDFARQFDKLTKDNQDFNQFYKGLKDHHNELYGHFDRLGRKQEELRDALNGNFGTFLQNHRDLKASLDSHREDLIGSMNGLSDKQLQVIKSHTDKHDEVHKMAGELLRKHDEFHRKHDDLTGNMNGLSDKQLQMIKSHTDKHDEVHKMAAEILRKHDELGKHPKGDADLDAVAKALKDHQKDVAGHFDRLYRAMQLDSVTRQLADLDMKVDKGFVQMRDDTKNLDPELSKIEKLIRDNGCLESGTYRMVQDSKRAIEELTKRKLGWVQGS
jgi:ABC-type transporter Mla subunit MlaD